MATREEFFASLVPSSIEPTPMPELGIATIDVPLRGLFAEVLDGVGGHLGDGSELADVNRLARQLVGEGLQVLSLVEGVAGNRDAADVDDPHDLADIDYTIVPARLAVAENGAVWISGEDLVARNSVFICEHLIAVVDEGTIVGTMSEAVSRIGRLAGGWGVFISGPSKTADIEQALVMGAHGARSMTVYLLGCTPRVSRR
jgi:L-lactate dehydrogenase complex protein LldG